MSFEQFTFKPEHQPDPDKPVTFELKPLNNPMLFRLINAYGSEQGASWTDLCDVMSQNVVGWSGLPQEYSKTAKAELLTGEGNVDLLMWLGQCARELYNRAVLKATERKNS